MPPELNDAGAAGTTEDVSVTTATIATTEADAGDKGTEGDKSAPEGAKSGDQPAQKGAEGEAKATDKPAEAEGDKGAKTIADGKETKEEEPKKPYWPEDWREKMAEFAAAGDAKEKDRLLKQLGRYVDPAAIFGKTRELESKFSAGGLIKVPGKDAKPEEIAAYQKALGWSEKPEEMFDQIKLDNEAVLGDADKPVVQSFLQAVHGATSAQDFLNRAINWNFKQQEDRAAEMDEADDTFRRESERALKDELGPAFQRTRNAIAPLFATAPGGTDTKNENALITRILGGRTTDGRIIGNDPDVIRWLAGMAHEVNPAATVTEDGDQSGKTIEAELAEIRALQKTDSKKYWSDAVQKRELELIAAQQKIQARA